MFKELTLASLLSTWVDVSKQPYADLIITHLELDSRKVTQGDTFVAVKGHVVDGRNYIDAAISAGANAVIAEACELQPHGHITELHGTPVIYIQELNTLLSTLAAKRYPLISNQLIGVTGTNGKTTITQLIAQWLELLHRRAAVMGTTGNGFLNELKPAANTTGNAVEVMHTLHELEKQGAQYTALEVSSHGLVQGRVKAVPFKVGVFTNLSRDHLDYHGTMEDYADAKFLLFSEHHCQHAVINIDDSIGASWAEKLPNVTAVSLTPKETGIWATQVHYSDAGIDLCFDGLCGQGQMQVPLIGEFNACNVLLAFATLLQLGFSKQALTESAPYLKPVLGRMELFQAKEKAKVVVDYAHTPDALEKALMALRVHCQGKLWTIFGCGGDRDTGKRPMMAEIAERLGDEVILTDDNPRSESPQAIIQDMLSGLREPERATVEHGRYDALRFALAHASAEDIILLAGKGHEDYQVMAHETIHYSDRESAQQLLGLGQ